MQHYDVLDSLADAIVVGDPDDRIIHVNPAAERLLGWAAAELVGSLLTVLMPERMREAHSRGFRRFTQTKEPKIMGRPVRVPALRKDGGEIDVELTLSTFSPDGSPGAYIATMRDLRERVELERQLRVGVYLKATVDGAARLTAKLDVAHVVETAADVLATGFDAALGRVWLFDARANVLLLRSSAGLSTATASSSSARLDRATSASKVAEVARTLVPFVSNALRGDPRFDQAWLEKERIECVAVLPLTIGGELRGVLAGFFRERLDEEAVQSLTAFAALTASALNDSLLHESERAGRKRFEDFVNGIDHAIAWEADAVTLRVTFVSAKAESLLGYPLGQWYAEPTFWIDRVHTDDRARVLAILQDAVINDRDIGFEHRFVKASGEVAWLHTGARLARTGPGAGTVLHALSADVTHLKLAEGRAAAAARQLDTILRGVSEGITAQGADGSLLYVNDAAARLSGFGSAAEMIAASPADILGRFELLDEEGRPFPGEQLPGRLAVNGHEPADAVVRFRDVATGTERWSIVSARPVLAPDRSVEMIINVFRDVTETKRVEQGLRFLSEAGALLASSLDYEETLRSLARLAVPGVADWCSIHLLQENALIGPPLVVAHVDPAKIEWARELSTKYPPDPNASTGIAQVIRSGRAEVYSAITDPQIEAAAVDAEHLRLLRMLGMSSVMIVPIAARGRVLGAISFIAAESGRRYAESDLVIAASLGERAAYAVENARLYAEAQRARELAEDATRLKDEFLATVSHELRTPLSSILGWSAMLQGDRGKDSASVQRGVEVIERNARSQLRIVEDILDVSRIIRGELRLDPSPVHLDVIAREGIESIRPSLEAKRIQMDYAGCDGPCLVVGDPDRLRQILWNLLSNALKFTPEEGTITLTIRQDGGKVVLQVRDTGVGIDRSFLPHVFERFRQADSGPTRSVGGLGLGLAIVRHLVEMHGGSATVESEGVGKGTTFTITLPIKPFTTPEETLRETVADSVRNGAASLPSRPLSGLRLLVVEDEPDSRELIELVLASHGADVATAASADEALSKIDGFMPSVLVSDIGMPVRDGYWLLDQVRRHRPTLPALALTAFTRREDVARILSAGFDAHVGKPVDPKLLVERIAALRDR